MQAKRIIAVVLSLCMLGGEVSCGAPFISQSITAQAATTEADCYSFNATTGVFTLSGNVNFNDVRKFSKKSNVKMIIAKEGTVFPEKCLQLFESYYNCTSIDLSKADTSNVTNMEGMFWGCRNLNTLNLSGFKFDTSKVTSMKQMFKGCSQLTSLDLSSFDTSNVTVMTEMFYGCINLTKLDLSNFDTNNVTNMANMFFNCKKLTSLDLSFFNTKNVEEMSGMFGYCDSLTSLDLSRFDTSNVTSMAGMFSNCTNLATLDINKFDTSNVTNMATMFFKCNKLTSLDLSFFNTSNVTNMERMFSYCNYLTSLNLSSFDTSNVTTMSEMFEYCSLFYLDLSNFDTRNVTNMSHMFMGCKPLASLDLSGFDTSKVTTMEYMFGGCENLRSLILSGFETSSVTEMDGMFNGCKNLTSLDLSSFDTSSVKSMDCMFQDCQSLSKIDLSSFNISNVTNMCKMFNECHSLTSLDLSGFDSNKVSNMDSLFHNCNKLTTLNLSGFDTSNVTTMGYMFCDCHSLTSLDLSSFDTSNVSEMRSMFYNCSKLNSLDLRNFDTNKVTYMDSMFNECNQLKKLILGENFKEIPEKAKLPKNRGWVNVKAPETVISGDGDHAVIKNNGKNTYKIYGTVTPTYPSNIKFKYSEKYRQLKLTWDKVEDADRYGIAVYMAGKWKVLTQSITTTSYTTPKNSISLGATYRVAVAARVDGDWDTANAIKHAVTVTIKDSDHDDFLDFEDPDVNRYNYINIDDSLIDDINSIYAKNPKITQSDLDKMIGHVTYRQVLSASRQNSFKKNELVFTRTRKKDYADGVFTLSPSKNSDFAFTITNPDAKMSGGKYSDDDYNMSVKIYYFNNDGDLEEVSPVDINISHNNTSTSKTYVYALEEGIGYIIYVNNETNNYVGEYEIHVSEDNWVYAPYGGIFKYEYTMGNYFIDAEVSETLTYISDPVFYELLRTYEISHCGANWVEENTSNDREYFMDLVDNGYADLGNYYYNKCNQNLYHLFKNYVDQEKNTPADFANDVLKPSKGDIVTILGIGLSVATFEGVASLAGICLSEVGLEDSVFQRYLTYVSKKDSEELLNAVYNGKYNIVFDDKITTTYSPNDIFPEKHVNAWYTSKYINKYYDNNRYIEYDLFKLYNAKFNGTGWEVTG